MISLRLALALVLAEGGDNFTVLRDATERTGGGLDLDALAAFFAARSPVAPGPRDRITLAGG